MRYIGEKEFSIRQGQIIKILREKQNIAQATIADYFGLNQSTIATWESGKRRISVYELCRLAELFEMPIDSFIPEILEKNITRLDSIRDKFKDE